MSLSGFAYGAEWDRQGKGPVKVFILAGQSNMQGMGRGDDLPKAAQEPGDEGKDFKRLIDASGNVIVRKDVWIYYGGKKGNLTHRYGAGGRMGPEFGFGWEMGERLKNQVLLIKAAWGGHSLKEKFLPPSAGGPGPSYTEMVKTVHMVLDNLKKHFPGYDGSGYEIVGLVWHQAWNDAIDRGQRNESPSYKSYSERQKMLLEDLRKEFKTPGMLMTIGENGIHGPGKDRFGFRKAQARTAEFPELQKTVRFVKTAHFWDTNPKYRSNAPFHYNGSCRTFYRKGVAFGKAMWEMMPKITLEDLPRHVDKDSKGAYEALTKRQYAKAYAELRKFEKAYEANRVGKKLDEDALDIQETVLDILKREIDGPIETAIDELTQAKARGDLYKLSIDYPKYKKAYSGVASFDKSTDGFDTELKTPQGRRTVSAGRRFYTIILRLARIEAQVKGERTADHSKGYDHLLKGFAREENKSIYAKAALIAAEKLADPKHKLASADAYVQMVK